MKHEEITREVLEEYKFDIVILVTVDTARRLQISAADTCSKSDSLTVGMLREVVNSIQAIIGRDGNLTIH